MGSRYSSAGGSTANRKQFLERQLARKENALAEGSRPASGKKGIQGLNPGEDDDIEGPSES
jgi:hypothetical protein